MNGITYFKSESPYLQYSDDITKYCSLTGIEIDNNFLTLEGREPRKIEVVGDKLIITLYNDEKISCNISTLTFKLDAGDGIDKTAFYEDNIVRTDASLIETTKEIVVTGDGIGSYINGDIINLGTSIEEILNKILVKVYDVTPVLPSSNIGIIVSDEGRFIPSNQDKFEVGETITCTLSPSYTDGSFNRPGYSIPSGCIPLMTKYYLNDVNFDTTEEDQPSVYSFNSSDKKLQEGTYNFKCTVNYGQSTTTPQKSDGTDSSVIIPSGITTITETSIDGRYAFYFGFIPPNADASYVDVITTAEQIYNPEHTGYLNLGKGFCGVQKPTEIKSLTSSQEESSIILILPEPYHWLLKTRNSMGATLNVHEKWVEQTHFENGTMEPLLITDYWNGTIYHVYILHSYLPITYLNIIFGMDPSVHPFNPDEYPEEGLPDNVVYIREDTTPGNYGTFNIQ